MYLEDMPNDVQDGKHVRPETLVEQLARVIERWQARYGVPPREIWVEQGRGGKAGAYPVRERAGLRDGKIQVGPVPVTTIQQELALK